MYSNGGIYIPDRKPPMGAVRNPYLKINRGLVLDSMMWEGAGLTAEDLSGNGNDGTFQGTAPSWTSGKYGSAVLLDGTDEYIGVSDSPSLRVTTGLTIIIGFRVQDNTYRGLVSKSTLASDWGDYTLYLASGVAVFGLNDAVVLVQTQASSILTNTSYAVAATYDSSNLKIYIDGKFQAQTAYSTAIATSSDPLVIGGYYKTIYYMNGLIDFVMIYNCDLSAGEIAELSLEPFCGFRWPSIIELASYVEEVGAGNPWNYYAQSA